MIWILRMRARERKRGFGINRPLISILVSGYGESGDADEVQLVVVVLSYKFAGLDGIAGPFSIRYHQSCQGKDPDYI
ncbi:hypothetical protein Hanom_Chr16g01464201 [Helianthus anomalus]